MDSLSGLSVCPGWVVTTAIAIVASWNTAEPGFSDDPIYYLNQVMTGAAANITGWTDFRYDAAMAEAKFCTEPAARLQKSGCERMLLEAMPVIPLYFEAWQQLRKPYVRGIEGNSIDAIAWIDTNWRPS